MIIERIDCKTIPGDFPPEDLTLEYETYSGHTIEKDQYNA